MMMLMLLMLTTTTMMTVTHNVHAILEEIVVLQVVTAKIC
jgi:hypothetical protein